MHTLAALLLAAFAAAQDIPISGINPGGPIIWPSTTASVNPGGPIIGLTTLSTVSCPTVTHTGTICSTCAIPECILLKDITNPCGCPTKVPTVTVNFPCQATGGCDIGCGTDYVIATPTTTCPASTKKRGSYDSCKATVTVTADAYAEVCHCARGDCVVQKFVTAPCSCDTFEIATDTVTLPCPSVTLCTQCETKFDSTLYVPCAPTIPPSSATSS